MGRWDRDYDEQWWRYHPPQPLAARGGIKARSQRGAFAGSWWGKRWITALESFGLGTRLTRGRSYARRGQVLNLEIKPGEASAMVQGSRPTPYQVRIGLKKIENQQRAAVGRAFAADLAMAAKLMGGQLPPEAERCFEQAGAPLFPHHARDLHTWCSCPDSSNPCKHIAAVYYILAEEFDRDPFLLLTLRGIGRDDFMSLIGAAAPSREQADAPSDSATAAEPQPLDADPQSFWRGGSAPGTISIHAVPGGDGAPLARRLGPFPLWRGSADYLEQVGRMSGRAAQHVVQFLAAHTR
jgi:uncharacterized Zn finger protein